MREPVDDAFAIALPNVNEMIAGFRMFPSYIRVGGLRAGMGYTGCRSISEETKVEFSKSAIAQVLTPEGKG